jgi:hypothetical protein
LPGPKLPKKVEIEVLKGAIAICAMVANKNNPFLIYIDEQSPARNIKKSRIQYLELYGEKRYCHNHSASSAFSPPEIKIKGLDSCSPMWRIVFQMNDLQHQSIHDWHL